MFCHAEWRELLLQDFRIMFRLLPKTLAKTISYIGYHAPGEYGLFWDADGSMPWKEFYWALQEDPALRFVREKHIHELLYLGLALPFFLDANRLRLQDQVERPSYPLVAPPDRLHYGCPRKSFAHVVEKGLQAFSRAFLPLAADRKLAETLAKRRDPEPVMIEIQARKAHGQGSCFRLAGPSLYLIEAISADYLIFPLKSADKLTALHKVKRKATPPASSVPCPAAGSFVLSVKQFQVDASPGESTAKGKKSTGGQDWKRAARKLRAKKIP
jgi:putative RNA 2'-phosphotransferase